jgi:hypothetical protein
VTHPQYRYRVVETWGDVPAQIADLLGKDDAYLVYPEDRGPESQQDFMCDGEIVGGWYMDFVGMRPE